MEKFPVRYKKALIFTAHPDDLEGFIGGTVAELSDSNCKIYSVIFSEGNLGRWFNKEERRDLSETDLEDLRVSESELAKDVLKVSNVRTYDFDDREIPTTSESLAKIIQDIEKIKPDLILSFEYEKSANYDPHPDHLAVGKLVHDVISSFREEDRTFDYFVFTTLNATHALGIDNNLDRKRKAINAHRSQRRLNKIIFPFIVWMPDRIRGKLSGQGNFAEGFRKITF